MKKQSPKKPKFRYALDTPQGRRERAVAILLDSHGFMQQKWEFLRQKGMSDTEILDALNEASNGEVIRAANIGKVKFPSSTSILYDSRARSSPNRSGLKSALRILSAHES